MKTIRATSTCARFIETRSKKKQTHINHLSCAWDGGRRKETGCQYFCRVLLIMCINPADPPLTNAHPMVTWTQIKDSSVLIVRPAASSSMNTFCYPKNVHTGPTACNVSIQIHPSRSFKYSQVKMAITLIVLNGFRHPHKQSEWGNPPCCWDSSAVRINPSILQPIGFNVDQPSSFEWSTSLLQLQGWDRPFKTGRDV